MACGNSNTCDVSEKRGCGTSSVFDWLYQIESVDENNRKLVEVQFKGDRKDFFTNTLRPFILSNAYVSPPNKKVSPLD